MQHLGRGRGGTRRFLLGAMRDIPAAARTCRYVCVLAWLRHAEDPCHVLVEATWEGRVAEAPSGNGGFGYDPVFFVPEAGLSFAEMSQAQKAQLGHRGRAFALLRPRLQELLG